MGQGHSRGTTRGAPRRRLPASLLQGIRPVAPRRIPSEIVAGATLAALAIPEVMGYTTIAGMPVVTGLYTLLLPAVVYALFGSSRHLVVGADSATAAIMAASLAGLASRNTPEYVSLAGMLAVIAGCSLLVARVLRLGFFADFLSRTVLIGFLTGVGLQVAGSQLSGLLGIPQQGTNAVAQVVNVMRRVGDLNWLTVATSFAVLVVVAGGKKLAPRAPWALLAVAGAIAASYALSLSSRGVAILGSVPQGLPGLALPQVSPGEAVSLMGTAASIFVVILAQSAATSRAYAAKFKDEFDENVDLVGLGLANIAAGLSGTFVVNGSPTKTAMVDHAGGRSQLAQLAMAGIVLLVLVFLTRPLSYLPQAVLAAVVFLIGVELVDLNGLRTVFRLRPVEFGVAIVTAATVVFVGVQQGIILAIVMSVIAHLRHSYRPYNRLLFLTTDGEWGSGPLATGVQAAPGLLLYRFGASLYYANAGRFALEVRELLAQALAPVRWFCLVAGTMGDLDFTGSAVLRSVVTELHERGVTFVMCNVPEPVMAELRRDGLLEIIGEGNVYASARQVVTAFAAKGIADGLEGRASGEGPGAPERA